MGRLIYKSKIINPDKSPFAFLLYAALYLGFYLDSARGRGQNERVKKRWIAAALLCPLLPLVALAEEEPPETPPADAPEQTAPAAVEAPAEETAPVAAQEDLAAAYRGIVKVEVAVHRPDEKIPWRSGAFGRGSGTGFMVAPGLFLTNAHVVADAERILISPYADARKLPAQVKFVAHDADLALLEVEDASSFADIPCLKLSEELPQLEDAVRAIGYPIGGNRLSVTRGIVSRIDTITYAHPRNDSHLALQIDAAINPGNSGGPVLKGNEVIGVAFQGLMEANATGYVIPVSVIRHFLKDIEDGTYDGYVELGATFAEAENPALRRRAGLADDHRGCLVADVAVGSSCDGALQPGDIVLSVQGHAVDSSAMIELDGVRVPLAELAERAFKDDVLHVELLRDGCRQEADIKLAPLPAAKLMSASYGELPRYVTFGGLVFQPLHLNVIQAHSLPSRLYMSEMDDYIRRGGSQGKEDIVVLTTILPDEVNARFNNPGRRIVTRVNGEEVRGLAHLHSLLYPAEGAERPAYTVIELADAPRPLVIDNAVIDAANARIRASYNVPAEARLEP